MATDYSVYSDHDLDARVRILRNRVANTKLEIAKLETEQLRRAVKSDPPSTRKRGPGLRSEAVRKKKLEADDGSV